MRIDLQLRGRNGKVVLPAHYNWLVQSFIYRHLEPALADKVHNIGWLDGSRPLRLFAFSRLRGTFHRHGNELHFPGPLWLTITSPVDEFLESLAVHLVREGTIRLGAALLDLVSVEVVVPPPYQRPVRLRALSPITVYSTLETPDGRRKTYYYAPQEPEFGRLAIENLRRKIRAWTGEDLPPDGATLRPVKVSNRNLVVARYKGTVIKGWTGIYELDAPEPYFRMALDAGLGAKNSQGFGCVEVWEARTRNSTG